MNMLGSFLPSLGRSRNQVYSEGRADNVIQSAVSSLGPDHKPNRLESDSQCSGAVQKDANYRRFACILVVDPPPQDGRKCFCQKKDSRNQQQTAKEQASSADRYHMQADDCELE